MAIKQDLLQFIEEDVLTVFNQCNNLKMLEYGDQILRPNVRPAKEYWIEKGFDHTSVDLNGKRGAVVKDLSVFEDFTEWSNSFDVVYNIGTTEHVEPFEAQYTCFKIADHCCKTNGIMIHGVPEINKHDKENLFRKHCHYYYSEKFFETLIKESNYKLIRKTYTEQHLIYYAFQKTEQSKFMNNKELFLSNIAIRNQHIKFSNSNNYIYQKKA